MANTLSVMTNVLRNVVSKQRIRYKENGFNLDLAYVCDNIIAMGYPAEKYESMYRNRLEDVQKFLEENHKDHYKIYNLCLERSYDISKFHGRVSVYPFEDHNPPTIELIQQFCEDVDSWLKADPQNVAAVHCKAGKGRTGTMICCYLLYSGQQRTAEDALACYDEKRTKDRKGVTIPSQRRYVQYFSKLIRMGLSYSRRSLQFCEIRFSGANALHSQGSVHCSISVLEDKVKPLQNFIIDFRKQSVLDVKLTVSGDIKVELTKNTKKIFHFWFNTFFVTDTAVIEGEGNDAKYIYTLNKSEIDDAHKDKEHKCFSEDFKVVLVFYVDGNNVVRECENASGGQTIANHRQSGLANSSLPTIQSNNYSLPQNNSSGSEINFICDQKSSSSTSVSSSFGGATTDNSNGYESNSKRSTQHRSGGQNVSNIHHSHPYMAMHDDNSVLYTSSQPVVTTIAAPPGYMMEHERLLTKNQQCIQKNNMHHLQQANLPSVTATSTPNQRHIQRQNAGAVAGSNADGGGILDIHRAGADILCQTSANLNASGISGNTNYNHSTHNSSKTSSVSSQSSSVIGDNEEDWESGESSAKQLEHITLLLSTSSVTSSPAPKQLLPNNNTNTNLSLNDSSRSKQKINIGLQPSSSTSSSSSTSASSSTCTSASHTSISSKSSSKCPYNNCNTSSSSCTNRVAGGDDDDDHNDNENVDESKPKYKISDSNIVATQEQQHQIQGNVGLSLESKVRDGQKIDPPPKLDCSDPNSRAVASTTPVQTPSTRPKLMHLLMPPKNINNSHQSMHKPIFKRKSSYKMTKGVPNAATTGPKATNDGCTNSSGDTTSFESSSATPDTAVGSIGGVATTSKQKLKIKLKKNKMKLSQKFQWFQSYFRSDPVDFCENFVQQTTSIRRNSICSMASRTHKLSTTTPPSITPPPPPLTGANIDGSSSCEQLNDRGPGSVSGSTSNASIATGDLCEDYYSHICDNQLSFSNSPCKSPRSMADIVGSISGSGGHGGSFGSSFAKSAGSFHQQYFRERRETLPGLSSHSARRNNVVIVAAKPVRTNAIGFNIHTATNFEQQSQSVRQDSEDANASPASIYNTASCSPPKIDAVGGEKEIKDTPFVFPVRDPNTAPEDSSCNSQPKESPTKPQTKYSLNLVIVNECPSDDFATAPTGTTTSNTTRSSEIYNDPDSDYGCDQDQNESSTIMHTSNEGEIMATDATSTAIDYLFETKPTATTCASICSNSSSSGFCTSECCTTNSSSSSCNCNPFALVLERHVALAARQKQEDIILEVDVDGNSTSTPLNTSMPAPSTREEASDTTSSESNEHKCD
ncbi:serine-rich adhesin for platelets [Musca vetustissima]|uniref:serine-rich adhesin for platelets n=1 Tax=Musca vetustissima TaxID=27455 RepID=UPI002AB67C3E|nr:serine-rich adhesin for platelets [Musca vetustissima]